MTTAPSATSPEAVFDPDFSRPVDVLNLPPNGRVLVVEASPEERTALADRLEVLEVASLRAEVRLRPLAGGPIVRVEGHLEADLRQSCVVTLAPLAITVKEPFALTFGPGEAEVEPGGKEIELDIEADDPPEPIIGGRIDLGAVIAEHLALGIDPFPRAPDARFQPPPDVAEPAETHEVRGATPFAALGALKKK
ncbi:hypothetical protein F11_08575 [Rhodospirillum rubrum F11]|uniref:Conserved hypothetical cytosolic protein n=2 Tax=Rhodospirillum rubrum TaxID=1085 RepID=Q2RTT1_RHORT|nr:DUF177 domain-containing protein [Rhodospirillum rubrum]ABC22464.1 conserved hypothetical cytosolic protein [Rhodospirillum rubrum ATCC 11170]AEO48181.1 hypothetical protein F11_08575 [Rhodospirillum rubrum F11]MBK5954046.1 hypothetical protein [Rhodospirillum rubrum]QXG82096.1 DUF177 domain-containing protein [Rhodospirillum rubrum]